MQLPATANPSVLSAFDFVGGECFDGPTNGQPSTDLARSDGAIDSFDDLLKDALVGAKSLAFSGFNPTPVPVPTPVALPQNANLGNTIAIESSDSHSSASGTDDAAANLRQLVLGRLRLPISSEPTSPIAPAIDSTSGSIDPSAQRAISVSSDPSTARELTIPDVDASGTNAQAREAAAESPLTALDTAATDDAAEPVIFSLDEHRVQTAMSAADGNPPTHRESELLDESARSQLLPFAPIVHHNGNTTATGGTGIERSANGSQRSRAGVTALDDQLPASPGDIATPAVSETDPPVDTADGSASANAVADSSADLNTDASPATADAAQMTVDAAIVTGAVVTSSTSAASRVDSTTPQVGSGTARIDERASGARSQRATSADAASMNGSDAVADGKALTAVRSSRPRPEVVTAVQQVDDADSSDDVGSAAQVSATSVSGDAAPQAEPATTEPSVVQQVSQAVETWRDALQEQGSARFAAWLSPPDLGHVWVELTRSGEGITARLKASDDSVQSLLESQEPELRQALNDSGISVAELDLSGRAAGDSASDHHQQQPERNGDVETSAVELASPVKRGNPSQRGDAIDVRA